MLDNEKTVKIREHLDMLQRLLELAAARREQGQPCEDLRLIAKWHSTRIGELEGVRGVVQ